MKPIKNILLIPTFFAAVSSANAATTLMQTNFQGLTAGNEFGGAGFPNRVIVTAAQLDSVTTGGTWAFNTTRGAVYTINDSPVDGDHAFLADDITTGSNQNAGVISFASITLGAAVDFSMDAVTWEFKTATRRTGTNKGLRYEFFNGTTSVATLNWLEGGGLTLIGTGPNDTGSSGFSFLDGWGGANAAARSFSAVFEGTTLELNFGTASLSVALGSSSIDRMTVYSIGSDSTARGVFLDDMKVTQIPEPSAALLGGIGALMLLRRRRDA